MQSRYRFAKSKIKGGGVLRKKSGSPIRWGPGNRHFATWPALGIVIILRFPNFWCPEMTFVSVYFYRTPLPLIMNFMVISVRIGNELAE